MGAYCGYVKDRNDLRLRVWDGKVFYYDAVVVAVTDDDPMGIIPERCTGLLAECSVRGKEDDDRLIYEGDIVAVKSSGMHTADPMPDDCIIGCKVCYSGLEWWLVSEDGSIKSRMAQFRDSYKYIIVGDIHTSEMFDFK